MKHKFKSLGLLLVTLKMVAALPAHKIIEGPYQWADSMDYIGKINGMPALAVGGHPQDVPSHILLLNNDGSENSMMPIPKPPSAADWYGSSVAAGRVTGNNDNFVIVGGYGTVNRVTDGGGVYFFSLDPTTGRPSATPALSIIGPNPPTNTINLDRWAYSLATYDVDGDGVDDVLVGAQGGGHQNRKGYITILFMKQKDPGQAPEVNRTKKILDTDIGSGIDYRQGFPASIAPMSDNNFAIGTNSYVLIVSMDHDGNPTLHKNISSSDVGLVATGSSRDYFGSAVAARDFNGDGIPELLVGAMGHNSNQGAVLLLSFNPDWTIARYNMTLRDPSWGGSTTVDPRCGASLAVVDHLDIDGNLIPEIAIGCTSSSGPSQVVIVNDMDIFQDSDGDGYLDYTEEFECSDPNDSSSIPTALSRTVCRIQKLQEEATETLARLEANHDMLYQVKTAIDENKQAIADNEGKLNTVETVMADMMLLVQDIHDNTKIKDKRRYLRGFF